MPRKLITTAEQRGTFLRIGNIGGNFYNNGDRTNTIVVFAWGAPATMDNGRSQEAKTALQFKTDVFIPDYIGNGRSDGVFTPMNCVRTLLDLHDAFKEGCIGVNHGANIKKRLKYNRVIFIGESFGGRWIPLLPRFRPGARELGIFYGAVDVTKYGTIQPEESIADFFKAMRDDGYGHIYRGVLRKNWISHLANKDGLAPIHNIEHLKSAKVFIAHGSGDTDINVLRAKEYYERIVELLPNQAGKSIVLRIYEGKEHGIETAEPAIVDFLEWLRVERAK